MNHKPQLNWAEYSARIRGSYTRVGLAMPALYKPPPLHPSALETRHPVAVLVEHGLLRPVVAEG